MASNSKIFPLKVERQQKQSLSTTVEPEPGIKAFLPLKFMKIAKPASLPLVVDLRSKCPPVYDQGNLGSCTAQACACTFSLLNKNVFTPSRLFIYYNERLIDNCVDYDVGAYLQDGIYSLVKFGVCNEKMWPHIISKFAVKPPDACYEAALNHQVLAALNVVQTLGAMQTCLAAGVPFIVAINVYSSFLTQAVSKTGMVPMPNYAKDQFLGGHAVVCVGYDERRKMWLMRNSWGTRWGIKGYFYLPYNYLLDPMLSSDIWNITDIENAGKVLVAPTPSRTPLLIAMEKSRHLRNMNIIR
jgi:C1A family cysteine protease